MGYSCVDFVEDVLQDFVNRGLIQADQIEDDNPAQQVGLVLAALAKLLPDDQAAHGYGGTA